MQPSLSVGSYLLVKAVRSPSIGPVWNRNNFSIRIQLQATATNCSQYWRIVYDFYLIKSIIFLNNLYIRYTLKYKTILILLKNNDSSKHCWSIHLYIFLLRTQNEICMSSSPEGISYNQKSNVFILSPWQYLVRVILH